MGAIGGTGGAGATIITWAMASGAPTMPIRQADTTAARPGFFPASDSVREIRSIRFFPPGRDIDAAGA